MKEEVKAVSISVRDFAVPVPRCGSIESHSGYARQALEGQEIHLRVQRRRAKSDPLYQPEVPIAAVFERDGYRFRIEGRMDGLFRHDPPVIEEIKSTFAVTDLVRRLRGDPLAHPYCLQLLSYGYFYRLEHGVAPRLSFHLVSTRSGHTDDLQLDLDTAAYEQWLEQRLAELAAEARHAEKRSARRRKVAAAFAFPFPVPRPGQKELMAEIEAGMAEGKPMLLQAPTGLGKTAGVLYPVLREALQRGRNVVYVTPKNSQHSVAEEAVVRLREAGANLRSLSVTAKGKICPKGEPLCSPDYCEYARDYYGKVHREGILALLARRRRLKAQVFREVGEKFQVCPFELQIECAADADVLICDYNYVFAPRSALGRIPGLSLDASGKANLVIDEVHNLPSRGMECYSASLSSDTLARIQADLVTLPGRFRNDAEELVEACIAALFACGCDRRRPLRIEPQLQPFLDLDAALRLFLSRYLEADLEVGKNDPVLRLCYSWSGFTETLETALSPGREEFFVTFHPHGSGGTVRITCCDASRMLRECYGGYQQVVGFSATVKPFEYYARLSGVEEVRTAEFASPFPRERRKLLVIPQISTRYAHRERNYGKVAEAIARIAALQAGNYLVFLPSFGFLERTVAVFSPPKGVRVVVQEREMKRGKVEEVLETLRSGEVPTILFAVQGGSFAEGIDYAGSMAIGVFVVGPPLPSFDLEREEMRAYYADRYGAGFDYAYTIPAMARAVQAAGRVIRSEEDGGIVVLMDRRFTEERYSSCMPGDWYDEGVDELVSEGILAEIASFWKSLIPVTTGEGAAGCG